MPEPIWIGVRYCGGCNPRYDRVAVVNRLAALLPECRFTAAQSGTDYTAVLAVYGCPCRCAGTQELAVPGDRFLCICGWEDMLPVRDRLKQLLTAPPAQALCREELLALLPHRPPMLLLDEVSRLTPGVEAAASFRADQSLPCFAGHFPGAPVLPGIYLLEMMAQTAGVMLLSLPCYAGRIPLFMGVRQAHFRSKVLPGDQLTIRASLVEERRALGYALCQGQVLCGDTLAADAQIQLSIQTESGEPLIASYNKEGMS